MFRPTPEARRALGRCIDLLERRRRFRWQGEVAGPGSTVVSAGEPGGCTAPAPPTAHHESGGPHA